MKTNTISVSGLHSRGFDSKKQNPKYYMWYTKSWIVQWRKVNRKWRKESGGEVITLNTVQGRPHFRNNEELRGTVNITHWGKLAKKTGGNSRIQSRFSWLPHLFCSLKYTQEHSSRGNVQAGQSVWEEEHCLDSKCGISTVKKKGNINLTRKSAARFWRIPEAQWKCLI